MRRRWASAAALGLGAVLVAAGSFLPVVHCPGAVVVSPTPDGAERGRAALKQLEVSVVGRAFAAGGDASLQVHDTYFPVDGREGIWAARLILGAALASVCLAMARRPLAAWVACAVLLAGAVWFFVEVGAADAGADGDAAGWTAYPPLSTSPIGSLLANAWWVWASLPAGTLLVAASAWLRK